MRTLVLVTMLLVAAPAASALFATPASPASLAFPAGLVEPFPVDIKDAEVLMLLAPELGVTPTRLPIPTPAPDADVASLALAFGLRAGMTITEADVAPFRELHPAVAAPTLIMLTAMGQAWDMRDEAFADWTNEDIVAAQLALETGAPMPKVLTPDQLELLINAAILLSDTIESAVIPQLQAAAELGVWPAAAVADPVGVLRIGGTGNDLDTLDRFLSLDARGDDEYRNNAGGARLDLREPHASKSVAVLIDLSGADDYKTPFDPALGGASFGVAAFYDLSGDDAYYSEGIFTTGAGAVGAGLFRDVSGADSHVGLGSALGFGVVGFGYARDDSGDDYYGGGGLAGGAGETQGLGVFWDRGGADLYASLVSSTRLWGYALDSARGWFVDETDELDNWQDHPRACNGCIWTGGPNGPGGRGNDDHGGLAYLIAKQEP